MATLSDLAKDFEYLEAKQKELESLKTEDKITITISNYLITDFNLNLDSIEAQELKEAISTILTHGMFRMRKEIRGEL